MVNGKTLGKAGESAGAKRTQGRPGPSNTGRPMDGVCNAAVKPTLLAGFDGRSDQCSAPWRFHGMQARGASYGVLVLIHVLYRLRGPCERGAGMAGIHRGQGHGPGLGRHHDRIVRFVPRRPCSWGSTVLGQRWPGHLVDAAVGRFAQNKASLGLSLPR